MAQSTAQTEPVWTLADRLRKARSLTGKTQEALAAAIHVDPNTVSNAERGAHRPTEIVLHQWAEVCGVPYEWLITCGSQSYRNATAA